jgi:hypothetical protein
VVTRPVTQHGVIPGVERDQEQHDEQDHDPAHRVTRLVPCDDDAHGGIDQRDGHPGRDVEERRLMNERAQRHGQAQQDKYQDTQGRRGRG